MIAIELKDVSCIYIFRENACEEKKSRILDSPSDWSSLVADRSSGWYVTLVEDKLFEHGEHLTRSIPSYLV